MSTETTTKTWLDVAIELEVLRQRSDLDSLAARAVDWDRLLPILKVLFQAGVDPISHSVVHKPYVKILQEDLPEIRKLFGQLTVRTRGAVDAKTVRVSFTAERAPGIEFDYMTQINPDDECRIEQQNYTTYSLVCPTNSPA